MSAKTEGRKRTGAERWNDAVRVAYEQDDDPVLPGDEAVPGPEAILAMSDEELDRTLREAGVDLAALEAKADAAAEKYKAHLAKAEAAPPSEEPEAWVASTHIASTRDVRPTRRSRVALMAAVGIAAAGAVGVATYLATQNPPQKDVTPKPDAGAPPVPETPKTAEPKPAPPTATTPAPGSDKKKGP